MIKKKYDIVPAYTFTPIKELEECATELNTILKQSKKLKVEAEQKIFGSVENITIGDNSSFTINQNQTLMIIQVEDLAKEILSKISELKRLFPTQNRSLHASIDNYKTTLIYDALDYNNNNLAATARTLEVPRSTLQWFQEHHMENKTKEK